MLGHIKTKERGAVPRKFRPAHTKASRDVWRLTGIEHHRKNRKKRFTRQGFTELRMRRRSSRYEAKKQARLGHKRPNVWSGQTERQTARAFRVVGTSRGARLSYGPTVLNFHSGGDEFRRFSKREANQLSAFWARRYENVFELKAREIA